MQQDETLELMELIETGRKMSAEQASFFESEILAEPSNVRVRSKLLGYYTKTNQQQQLFEQLTWCITNCPSSSFTWLVLTIPWAARLRKNSLKDYTVIKKRWLDELNSLSSVPAEALVNAADFFHENQDYQVAKDLLLRAQEIDSGIEISMRLQVIAESLDD